jgi:hypothetical protein
MDEDDRLLFEAFKKQNELFLRNKVQEMVAQEMVAREMVAQSIQNHSPRIRDRSRSPTSRSRIWTPVPGSAPGPAPDYIPLNSIYSPNNNSSYVPQRYAHEHPVPLYSSQASRYAPEYPVNPVPQSAPQPSRYAYEYPVNSVPQSAPRPFRYASEYPINSVPQSAPQPSRYASEYPINPVSQSAPRPSRYDSEYPVSAPNYPVNPVSQLEPREPKVDSMGHRLIEGLVTVTDFMASITNRKIQKISDDRISGIMKDFQRKHFLHPNKVIKMPESFTYELYVYNISTKLGFPSCIFWCPNRHDFAVEGSGLLEKYHPIRTMIKDIEYVTNACLVRIEKKWSDRNQSWTLKFDFKATFTEAQINKLKNYVENLTK